MSVLAGAARMFYRHRFQLKRTTGFYDRGHYVRLPPTYGWHKGNLMAPSREQTQRLPEGTRIDGALTLYTDVFLQTTKSPNEIADRIIWGNVEYEVTDGERWASHKWYILTKVEQ
jgi:hypothetical protein